MWRKSAKTGKLKVVLRAIIQFQHLIPFQLQFQYVFPFSIYIHVALKVKLHSIITGSLINFIQKLEEHLRLIHPVSGVLANIKLLARQVVSQQTPLQLRCQFQAVCIEKGAFHSDSYLKNQAKILRTYSLVLFQAC